MGPGTTPGPIIYFGFFPKVHIFKGMILVVFPPQRWGVLG